MPVGRPAPQAALAQDRREIIDGAGRRVTVPNTISRVLAAGPPGSVVLYTLAPEMMIGWVRAPLLEEKPFLKAPHRDLPVYARLSGRSDSVDAEAIRTLRPDFILDIGVVDAGYVALADRVQAQLGVPYVLLDGSLAKTGDTYRALGALIGRETRAKDLAGQTEAILGDVRKRVSTIAADRKARVLYARGANGLGRANAISAEILDAVGALSVVPPTASGPRAPLTIDEVRALDPTVILAIDEAFYESGGKNPEWAGVAAIHTKRVYHAPTLPFSWLDDPPGVNRLIGVRWLAAALYPELNFGDLRRPIRDFDRRFYHQEPTAAQVETLMRAAAAH